jgi:hypothetical protein
MTRHAAGAPSGSEKAAARAGAELDVAAADAGAGVNGASSVRTNARIAVRTARDAATSVERTVTGDASSGTRVADL